MTSRRTSDVGGDTCVVDDDDEVWRRVSVGRLALVITWPEHRLRGFSEWTRLALVICGFEHRATDHGGNRADCRFPSATDHDRNRGAEWWVPWCRRE